MFILGIYSLIVIAISNCKIKTIYFIKSIRQNLKSLWMNIHIPALVIKWNKQKKFFLEIMSMITDLSISYYYSNDHKVIWLMLDIKKDYTY